MSWVIQSFKKYADFNGRSRRTEYWMFQLFIVMAGLLMGFISVIDELGDLLADVPVFPMVFLLGIIIPYLSLSVRRLHDTSHSGGWLLIGLIPILGPLILLYLLGVLDSDPGENEYGPNPKTAGTGPTDTTGPETTQIGARAMPSGNDSDEPLEKFDGLTLSNPTTLREQAEQGDAQAQFNLGYRYSNGKGVPQDYTEAVKWYRMVAERGYTEAQVSLGHMYRKGEGVPQDYTEAMKWFRAAAEQGDADAQIQVGISYLEGQGVPQDYAEATKWFRAAAEQGAAKGQLSLGVVYERGQSVPQDYVQAHKWFNLASVNSQFVNREYAGSRRDELAEKMTREQIAEAQRLATEWEPKTWKVIRKELKICPPE